MQKSPISLHGVSILLSGAVVLANYPVFTRIRNLEMIGYTRNVIINIIYLFVTIIGGYFVAVNILKYVFSRYPQQRNRPAAHKKSGHKVFFLFFSIFATIDLAYLFLLEYPCHISIDSLNQILQAYTNSYQQMHPIWHTMMIKLTMSLGYGLFSDINAAAATYSVVQLLLTCGCFAYVMMTLYQAGMPRWCLAIAFALYGFIPYNIALSITMWKDVPFSLGILLMVTSLYRILRKIGPSEQRNLLFFAAGALLFGIMRTNGALTLGITGLLITPFLWRNHRKVLVVLLIVLLLCLILTGPVEACFLQEAEDYEILEPLSVPIQQIARVITEGCSLTEAQLSLINRVMDVQQIPQYYNSENVDYLKVELRKCDLTYFRDHMDQYFDLWMDLGLAHPWEYIKAWVDQTKGYWNGGYDYYQYAEVMEDNNLGLEKAGGPDFLIRVKYLIFGLARFTVFCEPLNSIGLHVWMLLVCWVLCRIRRRPEWMLCVPGLIIILGLLLGTPVYNEFRYAYPVFLTLPLIIPATLYSPSAAEE